MAASDALSVVALGAGDVDAGLALSGEAGWNQTGDDWRHFIAQGEAIGVRDDDGRLVASAAALPYDGPFGFVGMVLVTAAWRRRGLATHLVDRCIAALRAKGLTPVLDATEAGEQVYLRQGFVPQFRFQRWQGVPEGAGRAAGGADGPEPAAVAGLDAAAFGAARPHLIGDFLGREGTTALLADDRDGFAVIRRGRRALQAGPVVAGSEQAALRLLERLFAHARGAVFVDVPTAWREIGAWLAERGFSVQRGFARMALGRAEPFGRPDRLFAVAGPEFG